MIKAAEVMMRGWRGRLLLGGGLVGLVLGFLRQVSDDEPQVQPMTQEVYVWLRVWTEQVDRSVTERLPYFARATVLVAEVNRDRSGGWKIEMFADPLAYAKKHEVALAIRIGSGSGAGETGNLGWDPAAVEKVLKTLRPMSKHTKTFQIDYDCPTGKLANYVKLCVVLKKEFPDHAFEITCLPDWLDREDFQALVNSVDRFVMQVHGVSGYGGAGTLCDPRLAQLTAERCGEFGVPYLIALPTYRHAVRRNAEGKVIEVVSEGGGMKPGVAYELMSARQDEMAQLVRAWKVDRPAFMQGVIWYRLPVEGERMNWTWSSLQRVMCGEEVDLSWKVRFDREANGSYVMVLEDDTEASLEWPTALHVSWSSGFCVASDTGREYQFESMDRQRGVTCRWKAIDPRPVPPGVKIKVAWFRFSEEVSVPMNVEIRKTVGL